MFVLSEENNHFNHIQNWMKIFLQLVICIIEHSKQLITLKTRAFKLLINFINTLYMIETAAYASYAVFSFIDNCRLKALLSLLNTYYTVRKSAFRKSTANLWKNGGQKIFREKERLEALLSGSWFCKSAPDGFFLFKLTTVHFGYFGGLNSDWKLNEMFWFNIWKVYSLQFI